MEFLKHQLYQAGVVEAIPVVTRLLDLKQAFASAHLEDRQHILMDMGRYFQETTGIDPNRGIGHHYADRSIIYEDASRNFTALTIGNDLAHDLVALCPIWDLLWIITEYDQQATQQMMVDWFRERFSDQQHVSFIAYAQAFIEDADVIQERLATVYQEVQQITRQIFTELVPPDNTKHRVVHQSIDTIQRLTRELGLPVPHGVALNPDLLIAAKGLDDLNAGRYRLVLGEIHASVDLLTHSPLTYFLSETDRDELQRFVSRQYAAISTSGELIVDVIRLHLRKTSAQLVLEGPHIEAQGRSPKARRDVVALADLEVHLNRDRLQLYAPTWQIYLRLTSMRVPNGSDERTSLLRPFALPDREGVLPLPPEVNYCPRIEVERLVLLRRTWRLHYHEWRCDSAEVHTGWNFDLFVHMLRLQQHLDLPKNVFAKIAGEPKPVFLDFHNYFLIHAFYKLWSKHKGMVILTEANPDADDTWLEDDCGHYSCEFRMGFYRVGNGPIQ